MPPSDLAPEFGKVVLPPLIAEFQEERTTHSRYKRIKGDKGPETSLPIRSERLLSGNTDLLAKTASKAAIAIGLEPDYLAKGIERELVL